MNAWAFWSTVHLLWLEFQAQPLVVYLEGPSLYGAGLPFLVSLLILYRFPFIPMTLFREAIQNVMRYGQNIGQQASEDTFRQTIVGLFLGSVVIGAFTGYWTDLGYHFFDAGILVWPLLAFLSPAFHPLWAYPLTYFAMLFDDVWGAGQWGHWAGDFWFGVGGAGFHDGLFIGPATALILSIALASLSWMFRKSRFHLFAEGQSDV